MKNILSIGNYNKEGKFTFPNWISFTSWIRKYCDRVEVYGDINPEDMKDMFGSHRILREDTWKALST